MPDVRLAERELVEGDVAREREGDLLNGSCHLGGLRGGRPRASLSTAHSPRKPAHPSTFILAPSLSPPGTRQMRPSKISSAKPTDERS
jgi:hypothetical protein